MAETKGFETALLNLKGGRVAFTHDPKFREIRMTVTVPDLGAITVTINDLAANRIADWFASCAAKDVPT